VPSNATKAQIDSCLAQAVAAGHGTWVVFPAGKFSYSGTLIVPDFINLRGQGIWDQGTADGAGGTWLETSRGMDWGSYSTVQDLLVGENAAGGTCSFSPVARGNGAAGAFTKANGSQHDTFDFVRFKGGSDSGASLITTAGNFGSGLWSGPVMTCDMIDTNWYDCEFERPQLTNAYWESHAGSGNELDIWLDCRKGGGRVYGNGWYRCHFGVKNGYHAGLDGYGIGQTILFQPAPAEHASDGPRPYGHASDMTFQWSQVDHGFHDNHFEDCLVEYSLWYPMDICDYARSYSLTHLFGGRVGANPPTTSQASVIPDRFWNVALTMTHSYIKGSYPTAHGVVGEIGKDCTFTDDACGTGAVFNQAGSFGNVVSGTFPDGSRPVTPIFPGSAAYDWRGAAQRYTASPYDP